MEGKPSIDNKTKPYNLFKIKKKAITIRDQSVIMLTNSTKSKDVNKKRCIVNGSTGTIRVLTNNKTWKMLAGGQMVLKYNGTEWSRCPNEDKDDCKSSSESWSSSHSKDDCADDSWSQSFSSCSDSDDTPVCPPPVCPCPKAQIVTVTGVGPHPVTIPKGYSVLLYTIVGGGGGGAAGDTRLTRSVLGGGGGGGGGGSGDVMSGTISLADVKSVTLTVGDGGAAGVINADATNGEDSYITLAYFSTSDSSVIVSKGGQSGLNHSIDINPPGYGNGGGGFNGGGGGGAGGNLTDPVDADKPGTGGRGDNPLHDGHNGFPVTTLDGGLQYGGNGGNGGSTTGGVGGFGGRIVVGEVIYVLGGGGGGGGSPNSHIPLSKGGNGGNFLGLRATAGSLGGGGGGGSGQLAPDGMSEVSGGKGGSGYITVTFLP